MDARQKDTTTCKQKSLRKAFIITAMNCCYDKNFIII